MVINIRTLPEIDRRLLSLNNQVLWAELSLAQKTAASSLFHYGFNLSFIRISSTENMVCMLLDGKPATINSDGDIDTSPEINIRKI